jgi:hypothetical protein
MPPIRSLATAVAALVLGIGTGLAEWGVDDDTTTFDRRARLQRRRARRDPLPL